MPGPKGWLGFEVAVERRTDFRFRGMQPATIGAVVAHLRYILNSGGRGTTSWARAAPGASIRSEMDELIAIGGARRESLPQLFEHPHRRDVAVARPVAASSAWRRSVRTQRLMAVDGGYGLVDGSPESGDDQAGRRGFVLPRRRTRTSSIVVVPHPAGPARQQVARRPIRVTSLASARRGGIAYEEPEELDRPRASDLPLRMWTRQVAAPAASPSGPRRKWCIPGWQATRLCFCRGIVRRC